MFSVIIKILGSSGEVMREKVQVLGIEIDNCTVKEAMKDVVGHLQEERMNVVEMVTMNTLSCFQASEDVGELFSAFDIALPSDRGILQAAGIEDERRLKEVDELLFIKLVMRYLNAHHKKVFLLAKTEASLTKLTDYVEEEYSNIRVIECASLENGLDSDDKLLNRINCTEVDCVISALPSPTEEYFVVKNKALVNARLWLGLGHLLSEMKQEKKGIQKIKELVLRKLLKKEVERERKKKDSIENDNNSQ